MQNLRTSANKRSNDAFDVSVSLTQPTELARALRHAGARREAIRFVLKELRCPTCEARPLPLPPSPGMLPRCQRFNQCICVDLVDLEIRDGTSAKALNVVCRGTGLQIVHPLWTSYTAKTVMKEFEIAWVKHYGWWEMSSRTRQELQAS